MKERGFRSSSFLSLKLQNYKSGSQKNIYLESEKLEDIMRFRAGDTHSELLFLFGQVF